MAAASEIAKGLVRAGGSVAREAEKALSKPVRDVISELRSSGLVFPETVPINAAMSGALDNISPSSVVNFMGRQDSPAFPDILKYLHDMRTGNASRPLYAGSEGLVPEDISPEALMLAEGLMPGDAQRVSAIVQDMALQSLMAKGLSPDDILKVYRAPQVFTNVAQGGTPKVAGTLSYAQDAPGFFKLPYTPAEPTPVIQFGIPANKVLTDTAAFPKYSPSLAGEAEIQALRKDAIRQMSFDDQYKLMEELAKRNA